jgi:glycosyltransferase involved in cell wall biosynthesis
MTVHDASLSLVLPTRNDAPGLAAIVHECLDVLPAYFSDYEIIIVDDGSQDATAQRADYLAATCEPVMVIHHAHPRGYGRALVHGLSVARGDYLLCLDISSTVHAHELVRLMPFVEHYDVIIGHRLEPAGRGGQLFRRLVNWLFALDLQDTGCRLTLFRADQFQWAELLSRSPLVHIELYVRAIQRRATYVQVGLAHNAEEQSHVFTHIGIWLWWELLRLRFRLGSADTTAPMRRPLWRQKTTLGAGVAAIAGGIWFLLRRRGP